MNQFFLSCAFLISSLNPAIGQKVTYPTELIKLDSTDYRLEDQQSNFILGLSFKTIFICGIYYHKQAEVYYVFGFVDNHNYEERREVIYTTSIKIIDDSKIVNIVKTSNNGIFSLVLQKGQIARFNEEEGYYTDLVINYKAY